MYNFVQQEYQQISKKCRDVTVSLLDECRTSNEVKVLLTQKDTDSDPSVKYSRLKLAIDMGIKEVCLLF